MDDGEAAPDSFCCNIGGLVGFVFVLRVVYAALISSSLIILVLKIGIESKKLFLSILLVHFFSHISSFP